MTGSSRIENMHEDLWQYMHMKLTDSYHKCALPQPAQRHASMLAASSSWTGSPGLPLALGSFMLRKLNALHGMQGCR